MPIMPGGADDTPRHRAGLHRTRRPRPGKASVRRAGDHATRCSLTLVPHPFRSLHIPAPTGPSSCRVSVMGSRASCRCWQVSAYGPLCPRSTTATTARSSAYCRRGHQLGSVLDPCTQIRQKPWRDRAEGFRAQSFGNDAEPYEPDRARLSDEQLLRLALEPVDAQRGRGSTLMLTTFHVAGVMGTRGRDIELVFAGLGIEHFRRQHTEEPPAVTPPQHAAISMLTDAAHGRYLISPRPSEASARRRLPRPRRRQDLGEDLRLSRSAPRLQAFAPEARS